MGHGAGGTNSAGVNAGSVALSFGDRDTAAKRERKIPSGIAPIDEMTNGGFAAGLHTLGGKPGSGKSSLSIVIARNVARSGVPTYYFSYEMNATDLVAKLVSETSAHLKSEGVTTRSFAARELKDPDVLGAYGDADWQDLGTAARKTRDECSNLTIFETGTGAWTVEAVAGIVAEEASRTGKRPFVVIDYLQVIPTSEGMSAASDKQRVDHSVETLRAMALGTGCPTLVLSSLSRSGYDGDDMSKAFKESGIIEYSSTTLMALTEPDLTDDGTPRHVELRFIKQREGRRGVSARLRFDPENCSFEDDGRADGRGGRGQVSRWRDKPNGLPSSRVAN